MINDNLQLLEKIENSLYDIEVERGYLFDKLQDIIDDFDDFSRQYKESIKMIEKEKLEKWKQIVKNT